MNPITKLARRLSRNKRAGRARIFRDKFALGPDTKILDLRSEAGENIERLLKGTDILPQNVYIADIDAKMVGRGARSFGFQPVEIAESGELPFADQFFDIVYCSSVIEHVTVPKDQVWEIRSGKEFRARALARQEEFSNEIRRLGKQYFVQTPYRWFPIESHSWLPFAAWLPRRLLIPMLKFSNTFWVKKTNPDWCLLTKTEMRKLFSESEIIEETVLGLTKSMMAVKANPVHGSAGKH
jgi:SAM-dependent methyltransferase